MSTVGIEKFTETLQCLVHLLPQLTWQHLEICVVYIEQVLSVLQSAIHNQTLSPKDALGDLVILPPVPEERLHLVEEHEEGEFEQVKLEQDASLTEPTLDGEFQADLERIPHVVVEIEDKVTLESDDIPLSKDEIIITEQSPDEVEPFVLEWKGEEVKAAEPATETKFRGGWATDVRKSTCGICDKVLANPGNLKVHMATHSKVKLFTCAYCSKHFSTKVNLQRHERSHTGDRPFECPECFQRFAESKTMVNHLRRHTGEKPYKCPVCQDSFAQNSALRFHMMRHSGQKPYTCDICASSFRQSHQLTVHKRRKHLKVKDFECGNCQRAFATKGDMMRHIRSHSVDKTFLCAQCPAVFSQASSLRAHSAEHRTPLAFTCTTCSVGYKTKNGLTAHQRKTGHVQGRSVEGQDLMAHLLASQPQAVEEIPVIVEAITHCV